MKNQREYIKTDTRAFKDAERNNARFNAVAVLLQDAIKGFGVDFTSKELLKMKDIKEQVTKIVFNRETKDSPQPKGINQEKYLDMLDIDLSSLNVLITSFNSLSSYAKGVKEEDYRVYATTKIEIERIKDMKVTRDALNVMLDKGVFHNPHQLNQATGSMFAIGSQAPHRLELK